MVSPQPVRRAYLRGLMALTLLSAYENQEKALEMTVTMLGMARELGDQAAIAVALEVLGYAQFLGGELETARATFTELLEIQVARGDTLMINRAKSGLAQVLVALARVDEARRMAHEVVEVSRTLGDRRNEHFGVHYLADCALFEGNCTESLALYHESLLLAEVIGDRIETGFEVEGIAMSLAGLGHHATAIRLGAAMRAERARHGITIKISFWEDLIVRYLQPARDALGLAATVAAEEAGRAMTFEAAVAEAKTLATQFSTA
jgi:tetratricopeptide (TPR) repeat protein